MHISAKKFQNKVLSWFSQHGRKDLPWQINKTPYRVWVSEIMLQQTQVATVIPYYLRFMEKFPNVESLAKAHEDEVLHLWTGLGYYNRARNLHKTSKIITELTYFPDQIEEIEKLPGIGQSTAGAILASAFEKQATILDGNVKRVLTRLLGITEWPGNSMVMEKLWEIAEQLTPKHDIADYTQAMMDLGATVCTRGKPACDKCPVIEFCLAKQQGIETSLPRAKPKKTLPVRQACLLILKKDQSVLLEKRAPVGIWGGLWSLPEIPGIPSSTEIKKFCKKYFSFEIKELKIAEGFRHTFSHFHLDILPVILQGKQKTSGVKENMQIWYDLRKPASIGLPAPVKKLLLALS